MLMKTQSTILVIITIIAFTGCTNSDKQYPVSPYSVFRLEPGEGNPRNSEGDFFTLNDGRILFVYTHFNGGAGDHASAHLAGRFSNDDGKTWSDKDLMIVPNEGDFNIMSVSLLRLQNGNIALFYLVKNSHTDCSPHMRISTDEAKTWSDPVRCVTDSSGYFILNNDRAVQLSTGRIILPLAMHNHPAWPEGRDSNGVILSYISDDDGKTWHRSVDAQKAYDENHNRVLVQEPGIVELADGKLYMFCRTNVGCQYVSWSKDQGEHWTPLQASNIMSPRSPASIERIPGTKELLMVWNNHENIPPELEQKRTPFTIAISKDEGRSWENKQNIETNPNGWYCYTAIHFTKDHILLGHCGGDRRYNNGLAVTQITRLPIAKVIGAAGKL